MTIASLFCRFSVLVIFLPLILMAAPEPMRPALLVVDMQNDYAQHMDEQNLREAVTYINYAIGIFDERSMPVFAIHHSDLHFGPEAGSEGYTFIDSLRLKPTATHLEKNYPNSFKKSPLKELLDEQGINTVFICGLPPKAAYPPHIMEPRIST